MKKQTPKVKSRGRLEVQKSWMGQRHGGNGSREMLYEEVYLKENGMKVRRFEE
jgi:hypothetical protein